MKRLTHDCRSYLIVGLLACLVALLTGGPALAQTAAVAEAAHETATGGMKTLAVVAVASYDELLSDIGFAGSLADRPEIGQMVEGMIALFTQGKGLVGFDKTKPWGVVVLTDGSQFLPIGCLPVTNANELIGLAQNFGVVTDDIGDSTTKLSLPNQQTLYVKSAPGWAYLGMSTASLAELPANPGALFAELTADYDVAARVSAKNAPEMYRQQAIAALEAGMQEGLKQTPDESDEQFERRQELAQSQMEQVVRLVKEIDDVTVGWTVDSQQQRTYADFTYRFLPGSKMAEQLAAYGQPATQFAGFYRSDAAIAMSFASKIDPKMMQEDLNEAKATVLTMRQQADRAIDENTKIADDAVREAVKTSVNDLLDSFEATVEAGNMDGGGSLVLHVDSRTAVLAAANQQPGKVESGLKALADSLKGKSGFPGVQWDAMRHEDVRFHTLSMPTADFVRLMREQFGVDLDEELDVPVERMFGKQFNLAVGIGSDAVYLAFGDDYLTAVQQAMDASKADPNKAVPPFELSVSLGPIMEVAAAYEEDPDKQQMLQSIGDMLQGEAQGRDHVRMVGQFIPNGLQYRFEAEEGVLRAIGKAAAAAQQQAQD